LAYHGGRNDSRNTIESFFSVFKRGARANKLLKGAAGKRLTYETTTV